MKDLKICALSLFAIFKWNFQPRLFFFFSVNGSGNFQLSGIFLRSCFAALVDVGQY